MYSKHTGSITLKIIPEDSWFNWLWEFTRKVGEQFEGLTAVSVSKSSACKRAEIQLKHSESMTDQSWFIDHEDCTDSATQEDITDNKLRMSLYGRLIPQEASKNMPKLSAELVDHGCVLWTSSTAATTYSWLQTQQHHLFCSLVPALPDPTCKELFEIKVMLNLSSRPPK